MSKLQLFFCLFPFLLNAAGPEYNAAGHLKFPEGYREWVYLSSGLGMNYAAPQAGTAAESAPRFDNVFVNLEAYRAFLQTGKWPEKSVFVLEIRASEAHVSINQGGHTQGAVSAVEVEVKDSTSKSGQWAFYAFPNGAGSASQPIARDASCYSCHGKNTAVENTFVQFYPTLLEVARAKKTLKADFAK